MGAALAGLCLTAALGPVISRNAHDAVGVLFEEVLISGFHLREAWPCLWKWWLSAAGLAPLLGLIFDLARPTPLERRAEREQARERRRGQARERRARRRAGVPEPNRDPEGIAIGQTIVGKGLLPERRGWLILPFERLGRHLLVVGASGYGKTETLLRIAWGVAKLSDWLVYVIDAKGDERTMRRFYSLMCSARRSSQARLFPHESYDGWRGDAREVAARLIQLIDWASEGGGTYFRDLSINLVRLACEAPGGPPRSSAEFLSRLRKDRLAFLWAGHARAESVASYRDGQIDECRQRFEAFFGAVGEQLDGDFAYEDQDCGYLLLNELLYGDETAKLARFLVEDFKQFVAARKPEGKRVLLIVDEATAVMGDSTRWARVIETVRSYGAAVVLAPQSLAGLGERTAAERILDSTDTVFLHKVPNPEELAELAGTKLDYERSLQYEEGQPTGLASARLQHQRKVDPTEARQLQAGQCFVITSGLAAKVQIAPAPEVLEGSLPERVERLVAPIQASAHTPPPRL